MKEYEHHPLADLFPLMSAAEIKDLSKDIEANGLKSPIVLYEGKILDGRHRYEACGIAGEKPTFITYKGNDPLAFVLSANLRRRHLTDSQRAMVAAKMETLKHGGDRESESYKQDANLHLGREKVAETLDVSPRSVATASKILDASPKLAKQVEAGKISLHAAHQQVKEKEAKSEPKAPRTDCLNRTIPADMVPDWDRAVEVGNHLRSLISEVKVTVAKGIKERDVVFHEITNPTVSDAEALHHTLSQIMPHVVCPTCQGRGRKVCLTCRGSGWISKHLYNSPAVSKAVKAILEKGAGK